jgi:anti-sigma B factor antagonist
MPLLDQFSPPGQIEKAGLAFARGPEAVPLALIVIHSTPMKDHNLKLEIRDGTYPGEKVMVLDGVLNIETAFEFRDRVRQDEPATLVVDMTRVRSVDSSGLGAIIGAYVSFERNCRRLVLAGMNDRIWDLFRTCKIDDVFTRYPTVADAEHAMSITA